jgi:hypothetical protein
LLPGGDREGGLAQLERASTLGLLVRGEAQFQIHVLYLWYEHKSKEALALVRGLQERYPHNPLFHQIEGEILDKYFHDHEASLKSSEQLLSLAQANAVHRPDLAEMIARLNIAQQAIALQQPARAREQIDAVIARNPRAPADAVARARELQRALR